MYDMMVGGCDHTQVGEGVNSTAMVAFEGQKGKLRERTRLTVAESQWGPRERTFSL